MISEREMKMLIVLHRKGYVPVGLSDFMDETFSGLVERDLVETYHSFAGGEIAKLTDAGRQTILRALKESSNADQ